MLSIRCRTVVNFVPASEIRKLGILIDPETHLVVQILRKSVD